MFSNYNHIKMVFHKKENDNKNSKIRSWATLICGVIWGFKSYFIHILINIDVNDKW